MGRSTIDQELSGKYIRASRREYNSRSWYYNEDNGFALYFNGKGWELSLLDQTSAKFNTAFTSEENFFCFDDLDKVKFSQYNSKISTTFDIKCAAEIINDLDNWTKRIVMPPSMPHVPNSAEETTDIIPFDNKNPDEFIWTVENWEEKFTSMKNTEYFLSPIFTTEEGYDWQVKVYPKGKDAASQGQISMYATCLDGPFFPLHGKQVTIGIIEQGKPIQERVTMRRSWYSYPNNSGNKNQGRGWSKFLYHDYLFYYDWNYVHEDSMTFSLMISEVTGVFLECDPHAGPNGFDSCLFKQDQDDDLDFDENGIIHERGLASVTSMPTWQWGERCLRVTIQAEASFTLSLSGRLINEGDGTTIIPWYRQRMYPTEQTEFVFLVDVGFDEYDIAIQQNINFEIMNHERSPVTFLNSKQLYGNCGNVPDKAKADNTVIIRSNSGIKYMRDRYASV